MAEPAHRPALHLVPGSGAAGDSALLSAEELAAAVQSGDRSVAAALYEQLFPSVDRAIVRVLGRRGPDHDDLLQSAFEQIVRSIGRGRFSGASTLATWASSIACHVALNVIRSRRRERRVIDRGAIVDDDRRGATTDRASARVDLVRVRACLAEMAAYKVEALVLHDLLGHDLTEIAEITGVSVAAAQTRLSRGRRELVALMDREPPNS
ncbi:hypothetical protein BH09MYX1_BH09MYX1_41710 [soil metagenome]